VTIFENSTDTAALAAARASVRPHEVQRIRDLYSIGPGPVLLFLGSVDRSKRPDFLVAAMREVWRAEPSARLVVAGEGDSLAILLSAGSGVIALGRLTGDGLAAVAALADVIVMPGRVGLVATDSFALETPIVTTAWPFHSPEFDYLRDGVNARILANDPVQFGQGVVGLLRDSSELDRLRVGCRQSAQRYTVENMVERFSEGALAALEAGPRRAVQLSESRRAANTPGGMPLTARSLVKAAVTRVGPLRRRLLTSTDYSVNPIVAGGQAGWASARAVGRQDRAWARIVDAALRGDVRSDVEALWRGLGATDARDLIEIGSGHGHLSELLTYRRPDLSYVGLDISLPMCAMARSRRPELSVVVGDAACLPFLSRSTDAVLDAATLMHVPEWRAALAEEGRVARRWLLLHSVTVADVDEPLRMRKWAYGAPVFEAVLSSTQLTKELARGGFAVVDRLHSLDYDLHEHIGVHTRSETWVCERHMR
jgi:SAM-dependent methyltransferase